jgi:dTDP-4-dehydrorhamnose 3,5-epimerase
MAEGATGGDGRDPEEDLLALTLAAAARDEETVALGGRLLAGLPDGVTVHRSTTIIDDRGSLFELFDPRWGWHPGPVHGFYAMTIRPGRAKGWALHREHADRYAIVLGEMQLVLYDVRPDSPTRGGTFSIVMSEFDRCQVNIPPLVWHGSRALGSRDVLMVNAPTALYDHANPDKYRLPLDSPLMPDTFRGMTGW